MYAERGARPFLSTMKRPPLRGEANPESQEQCRVNDRRSIVEDDVYDVHRQVSRVPLVETPNHGGGKASHPFIKRRGRGPVVGRTGGEAGYHVWVERSDRREKRNARPH